MCEVFADLEPDRFSSQTRRLRLNGRSTSIRLENAFWRTLDEAAALEGVSTAHFISKLHAQYADVRSQKINFTSLLRCSCLKFLENSTVASVTGAPVEIGMVR